nr:RNA-directed DNA polymerase, eukaryota, reverse transcriptase zinc-binding domain protein [Tanacetum cinerariifolium]
MRSSRVCISTRSYKFVSERVHVEIHEETFEVQMHELGNWSINVTDDSLDTSSSVAINDIEKVEDSIEENFVNDLNDLSDNLNEVAHDIKEDAVHMDKLKDTYTDQQHEYMEDKENNAPNASWVGESSDPSYPPGFEFMKRSFSNTSNYENTLGFDVRGCKKSLSKMINRIGVLLDIRIIALDRLWSDHTPFLFNVSKTDFGPSTFKLHNSWLSRNGFDEVNVKNSDRTRKQEVMIEIHGIEKRTDNGNATPIDRDKHVQLISEIDKLDNFEVLDLSIKPTLSGTLKVTNPIHIKELFLIFSKINFGCVSLVVFPVIVRSSRMNSLDRDLLEANISLDEIESAIWDCGSNKAQGPDGFSFAFVKKYWVFI